MMRQMRENTKWIMLITAIAFVALMVFEWGMDMTGRSSGVAGMEMGSVNGEAIGAEEYNNVYRNLYQQQMAAVEGPISPLLNRQIEDAAWEQLVTQRLLQQELERRGIRVTADEIRDAARLAPPPELQNAPVFQTDGQFDINKYHQFLATAGDDQFLQQLESYYRDVIPRSKLYFQTSAGVYVSDGQLWRMYRDANEAVTVQYLAFDPGAMIANSQVEVSEAAVRQYHAEHRSDFIRPAQVTVRYVVMDRSPPQADSAAALQRAQELRAAAAGGEPFEDVAQRAGDGSAQSQFYGEQFAVTRGQSAPAIDQAVFATPAGQITQPVLTQSGYHVIRVESRQADTAQIRQFIVPVELSRQNEDRLLDRADSLELAATTVGLEQAASRMGLQVQAAEVTPALPILPGVGAIDEGLEWAMEADAGEISDVLEAEQSFYMLELVSRRDEGALSLEEAAPTIRALLLRRAKLARAREILTPAAREAASGASLEQIGGRYNLQVQQAGPFTRGEGAPGLGRLNAAVGAAFGLRPGETSPLIEADDQLFLIRTVSRSEPGRAEWQAQLGEQRERVQQALADNRWNQYMLALRENAEIVDNRRALRQQAAAQ
jgi:peptidyl-prolyl cis-trans isomerase D